MDENSLAPPAQFGPPPPMQMPQGGGAPTPPGTPIDLMGQYRKLQGAGAMLASVREGLDSLAALGDTVTQADVVEVAGRLVAAGLDPTQVAGLLADMPQEGELLVDWITQQDAGVAQREQQLEVVTRAVRHELGVQAMQGLMMHHLDNTEEV